MAACLPSPKRLCAGRPPNKNVLLRVLCASVVKIRTPNVSSQILTPPAERFNLLKLRQVIIRLMASATSNRRKPCRRVLNWETRDISHGMTVEPRPAAVAINPIAVPGFSG